MEETVTAAHCVRCGRTGGVTRQGASFWCAWCAADCDVELRPLEVVTRATADRFTVDGQLVDPENAPLQPLRITFGWTVAYNGGLYEVDPTERTVAWWWIFKSDMMTLVHADRKRLLDLSWTDETSYENGDYRLTLYDGVDYLAEVISQWEGKDRAELVAEMERILERVSNGAL